MGRRARGLPFFSFQAESVFEIPSDENAGPPAPNSDTLCECLLFVMLYMLVCHLISRLCFVFVVFVRKQLLSLLEIWFANLFVTMCDMFSLFCFVFVFSRKQLLSLLEIWCLRNLLVLQNCTQCCM